MSIITASGLTRVFKTTAKTVTVLDDVSLSVDAGEFVAITGESGSGKSTLLQLLGGLDVPTSGQIVVDGQDMTSLKSDKELSLFRGRKLGFVFQHFYLQPFLTVRQNIELPAVFTGMPKELRAKRTEFLAEFLGLEDRLDFLPRELSGGQAQRAAILRALYNEPLVVLADEPTGSLDEKNAVAVLDLLKKINTELKTAVVLVTHDGLASSYASRVIHLTKGKVA